MNKIYIAILIAGFCFGVGVGYKARDLVQDKRDLKNVRENIKDAKEDAANITEFNEAVTLEGVEARNKISQLYIDPTGDCIDVELIQLLDAINKSRPLSLR